MSDAVADPWAALAEAVREADAVHADETGWRVAGAQRWLWLGASALFACSGSTFARPSGGQGAARGGLRRHRGHRPLCGPPLLDVLQQQLCWCHLIRQLVKLAEARGASGRRGAELLCAAREVFAVHRRYLEEGHELTWLRSELEPLRRRIEILLEQGARGRNRREAGVCAGLLAEREALWIFCEAPGIDPTNNAAERALPHTVIMRKTQLHTVSERGCRWIERVLSVNETCRLQGRAVLDYLFEAAEAADHGRPAPARRLRPAPNPFAKATRTPTYPAECRRAVQLNRLAIPYIPQADELHPPW